MNNINIYIYIYILLFQGRCGGCVQVHVQPEESTSSVPLVSKKSLKDYKLNS